jgi:MoaA/NifB/PqqE/SkfB family radical SAM enzyme
VTLGRALARAPHITAALWRLRRERPTFASVNLLNRCNQACPMCAVHAAPDQQLSAETLTTVFASLRRGRVRVVELSGGEPFLRRDLDRIVAALDRERLLYSFTTNATALQEEGLTALRDAAGLLQVAVSLDSLDPARYRLLRGRDLLPAALDGLARLQAAGLPAPVKLNFAMSRHNHEETLAMLSFAEARGLFLSVFPVNQGPGAHRSAGPLFDATPSERAAMAETFERLAALRRRGSPLWEPAAFYRSAAGFLRGEPLTPCGAGRLYLDVRADGAVAPCVELPPIGTVAELLDGSAWALLAASGDAVQRCRTETPCCYTCTVSLAETARHPLAFALESGRVLLAAAARRRRSAQEAA